MNENSPKQILIIDDDQFLVDMYAVKFKEAGFQVTVSMDGHEALTKLREKTITPSVLLMDIVMPELDGFAILDAVRKENLCPDALVIMLSNQGQESDREKAESLGVAGYIIKANSIPSEVLAQVTAIIKEKTHK